MKIKYLIIIIVFFYSTIGRSQVWTLKLRSAVELRTYKLTNKIDESVEKLSGASITLYKGSVIVTQMQSDGNGDFIIDVPANGDFILSVTYSGCNPKKFAISTFGVPEALANDNYKPTFGIEGVIMAKPFPGINYSVLQQPLAKIIYTSNGKKFDDDEDFTNQMLAELSKIRDAETVLLESFTSTNNNGDIALGKGDCPLAKSNYEKAMTIIPGERYPSEQLIKVGDCFKAKELADKKAVEDAAAKSNQAKLAAEKLAADKLLKENSAKEKLAADKFAKEKVVNEKQEIDKLAKEKTVAEKAAKDKSIVGKSSVKDPVKGKVALEKPKVKSALIAPVNSSAEPVNDKPATGASKYSIPQAIGVNKYKESIKRADELFKMKRYSEAKSVYEDALKFKADDVYSTGRLAEIEKLKK